MTLTVLKKRIKASIPLGIRSALRLLRAEVSISMAHRRGTRAARKYANADSLKLNIGCGPNLKAGWVNIDLVPCADLHLDMRERIPLPDGRVEIIYSEHF